MKPDILGATGGRGRVVAALLVVALLLCHGALGALHQASSWTVEHDASGHHAPAAPPASTDHHAAGAVAHADYAAVLFVVLIGAALALLWGRLQARGAAASPHAPRRVFLRLALPPPRCPTPPLLQVFRL